MSHQWGDGRQRGNPPPHNGCGHRKGFLVCQLLDAHCCPGALACVRWSSSCRCCWCRSPRRSLPPRMIRRPARRRRPRRRFQQIPHLKGIFNREDLLVQAIDLASHRGYQAWHRAIDRGVIIWLEENLDATPAEFLEELEYMYTNIPDVSARFPDALIRINEILQYFK